MTPKEKAKDLMVAMWVPKPNMRDDAKRCAIICADELIDCLPSVNSMPPNYQDRGKYTSEYWQEVKNELSSL